MKKALIFTVLAVFSAGLCGCAFLRYDPNRHYDNGGSKGKQKESQRIYDNGMKKKDLHR